MLSGVDCALFNVNETLPSMIWSRLENQRLMPQTLENLNLQKLNKMQAW
jgi:hypothetical protein